MKTDTLYRWLCSIIAVLLCLAALAVVLRVFVCDRFTVRGDSMEPTLHDGERIFVNKLLMGARIYIDYDFSSPELKCFRMPGLRKVRPGDVVVFNYPYARSRDSISFRINYVYTKRCIGAPGDTVSIVGGYYRNSSMPGKTIGPGARQMTLGSTPVQILSESGVMMRSMPYSGYYNWTIRDFGPLYVPGRGDTVALDRHSVALYEKLIENETGKDVSVKDGIVLCGGVEMKGYIFCEDYYFLAGDNVMNSKDSRYIGLVPGKYIVGIVAGHRFM